MDQPAAYFIPTPNNHLKTREVMVIPLLRSSTPNIYIYRASNFLSKAERKPSRSSCLPDPYGSAEPATMLPAVGNGIHWELEF
jgi:hypothetical protein